MRSESFARITKRTSKFFPWVSFLSLFFLFDGKWLSLRLKSPAACFTRFGEISGELVENFRRAYGSVRDSRLPTRSALNGAHRAPAPPDEGSCVPVARVQDRPERKRRPLRKAFHRKPFLPSCVCWRRTRPWGAGLTCRFGRRRAFATGKLRPTPCKPFEKGLSENFTFLPPSLCGEIRPCRRQEGGLSRAATHYSSSFSTDMNASWGTSTLPSWRMRFLPSFCFSSSFFFRVMSPP